MELAPSSLRLTPTVFQTVVHLPGTVGAAADGELRECLAELARVGTPTVVVDLSACRSLGSATVGTLLEAHRLLHLTGRRLVVVGPQGGVRDVLRATEVDRVLPVR